MNMNWLICRYCNLRCFMEKPTINRIRSKVYNTCINKLVYALKGLFMLVGNVIVKILK
jgi:hypothetical protein